MKTIGESTRHPVDAEREQYGYEIAKDGPHRLPRDGLCCGAVPKPKVCCQRFRAGVQNGLRYLFHGLANNGCGLN